MGIPFIDLKSQEVQLRSRIDQAIGKVIDHGAFIMGPEVFELEEKLADYTGCRNVVTCSSGTDALTMSLMAIGVSAGDVVFVPSFTFVATAEAVISVGAEVCFVDVDSDTYNMCPESLERAVHQTVMAGKKAAAVIPVDLYGLPANYNSINTIATKARMAVIADGAQSFGGSVDGRKVGNLAGVTTTSFFPAKPLGCFGDGGAVFTDCEDTAALLRSIRVHGQGASKYDNVRFGMTARLDTIQAAILLVKLEVFAEELEMRQTVANRYQAAFAGAAGLQLVEQKATSAWAQFTISSDRRDRIYASLRESEIPSVIYYPKAVHQQDAYRTFTCVSSGLPVTENLVKSVLSLPMSPYLTCHDQDRVIEVVLRAA